MPKHDVALSLITEVVGRKDIEVKVKSDGSALGTLLISKGNVEWLPANHSVNKYRLSWERFAELMTSEGRCSRR